MVLKPIGHNLTSFGMQIYEKTLLEKSDSILFTQTVFKEAKFISTKNKIQKKEN
jgi:hypothetical protein